MKWMLAFLGLMMLGLQGLAQQTGPDPFAPDAYFEINFQAISNSPPVNWSGGAGYSRILPPSVPSFTYQTNYFALGIIMPSPPQDAWIWEKEGDGFLTPICQVTNISYIDVSAYELQKALNLTTNQVHSLIAGNWYMTVDFSGSNYIWNLVPSFDYANGPIAIMIFPPYLGEQSSYFDAIISQNNRTAKVVLDGSNCRDPYYLPMQYSWTFSEYGSSNPLFTDNGVLITNTLPVGLYLVRLQLGDSLVTARWPLTFSVNVITPGQAVNAFISNDLQLSPMSAYQKRVLTTILSAAADFFNQGRMGLGCVKLEECKRKITLFRLDRAEPWLLPPVQNILDVFSSTNKRRM